MYFVMRRIVAAASEYLRKFQQFSAWPFKAGNTNAVFTSRGDG